MNSVRGEALERRRVALLVLGLLLAGGLILIFAGSLTRSADVGARAAEASAEIAELQARVDAGTVEIDYVEQEAFVDQVARSLGLGEKGEKAFALPADAPSPAPIVPIGSQAEDGTGEAPFDAWMALLFGA